MASRYPSQTETTNFARLSRLVLDVCSDILRDVLATHIPLPGLHAILKSQKHHLRQKLISRQLSILYPPGNVFLGTLKDLDFSLLYSLVRNIQGINISPHTKGWGKEPDATDRSLAANIDRLRVLRNEAYGHLPKASLSDTDFRRIWGTIRQCVFEIEQDVLSGDTYVKEVYNLLNVTMDPDTEKEYIERLKKQRDEFEAVVEGLPAEQESMSARQDTMETEQKSMLARQDTMETEQKSMSARQNTMEIEQKSMTARLDTVENQQKTMTANQEFKTKEIHPDLKPMIETTMNRIRTEKEKQFLETKAFHDAQDKLRMNKVLVIKGNTGDGKTSMALQLLRWLTEEEQCRKPLQLHKIKKLDLLAPNSNLVCIIDDIFGQKDISKSDEVEWNKRLKHVETLFVDKQNQTNILFITIRNEIFNALTEQSLGTVFTAENIVDLSSDTYNIKEEKQELLAMYTPKNFSWTEKEMKKILGCELHIGFPQCCHLFSKSDELQKKGAKFFENPFQFFKDALSKLPECCAILFLFLNNGEIKVNDLDPNVDKVDKTLLAQAFSIELVESEDQISLGNENKQVDFVRKSLDKLLGFLVRKDKYWSGEEVYRFDHESVHVTLALLYGKKTPVGYIKYPSQTETTNFARLSRLVLDVCSDILRDVLDTHIPLPGLHAILKSQKHNLRQKLKSRQLSILYPPGNVFPGTLEDLDFSLLYSLVRNLQGINISPHAKGWGREPDAADRSLAANIDRLRVQRNEAHGHLKRASLSNTDFRRIWGIIRQCISEIEQDTLTGNTYVREVDNLLNVTMDPDTEKELIQRLQEQQVEFETIVEGLKDEQKAVRAKQESMARDMEEMKEQYWKVDSIHSQASDIKILKKPSSPINMDETEGVESVKDKGIAVEEAVRWGHKDTLKQLLEKGADINQGNAVDIAVWEGDKDILTLLLETGADVNKGIAVEAAVRNGRKDILTLLLKKGADVNKGNVVEAAVEYGDNHILTLVLENGADVNKGNVVEAAAGIGDKDILTLLLEKGADVNKGNVVEAAAGRGDKDILTLVLEKGADVNEGNVVEAAAGKGDKDILTLVLEKGADVNKGNVVEAAAGRGDKDILTLVLEKGADVNKENVVEAVALMGDKDILTLVLEKGADVNKGNVVKAAARGGSKEILTMVLEKGADVNKGNPLEVAANSGYPDIVSLLLDKGADVHNGNPLLAAVRGDWGSKEYSYRKEILRREDEYTFSVSRRSCICLIWNIVKAEEARRKTFMVKQLLDHGADVNEGNPLEVAANSGYTDIVSLLLDKGADVNNGNPLLAAVRGDWGSKDYKNEILRREHEFTWNFVEAEEARRKTDMVKLLLDHGADVNKGDILEVAANSGYTDIVELLLDEGADVNNGNPLLAAVRGDWGSKDYRNERLRREHEYTWNFVEAEEARRKTDMVKLLLDHGADVNKGNPLEVAANSGYTDIVSLLLDKGADVNNGNPLLAAVRGDWGSKDYKNEILRREHEYTGNPLLAAVRGDWGSEDYRNERLRREHEYTWNFVEAEEARRKTDMVKLLLDHGADVNKGDILEVAANSGYTDIVELLLDEGADVNNGNPLLAAVRGDWGSKDYRNERLRREHEYTWNFVEAEEARRKTDMVKLLLDHGADVNKGNPLEVAANSGYTDIVSLLLDKGADVNNGNPLLAAVRGDWGSKDYKNEILRREHEYTGNPLLAAVRGDWGSEDYRNERLRREHEYTWSFLDAEKAERKTAMVKLLLDHGANVNKGNPVKAAEIGGHTTLVKLLRDKMAEQNEDKPAQTTLPIKQDETQTPVHSQSANSGQLDINTDIESVVEIVKKGDIEQFELLTERLKTLETEGSPVVSILHVVALYGSPKMIECIAKGQSTNWDSVYNVREYLFGIDMPQLREGTFTALYIATFLDRTKIVHSLIKYSSEENIDFCFLAMHDKKVMEEIFMLDQAEKLKLKHSNLQPTVIPGHRLEKSGSRTPVYIVYSVHVDHIPPYELRGIGVVIFRNPYVYTKEWKDINSNAKTVSCEDRERAKKILSCHQQSLLMKHSNLNIINVTPVRFQNNGEDIVEKTCIALYCSTKGVVPLGEPEFPKRLDTGDGDYMEVDVHEGYVVFSGYKSLPSCNFHPKLKMGCNIGRLSPEQASSGNVLASISGTLGPFVRFDNKIGFLTCAHVLFDIPNQSTFGYQYNNANKVEVVQPSSDSTVFGGSPCGHVHMAIFDSQSDPSVDVAVVELTDSCRIPANGQFANEKYSCYKDAGFNELPEYNNGYTREDTAELATSRTVFQFGSTSDVTKGTLDVCGISAQPLTTALGLPRSGRNVSMKNQYQVNGCGPSWTFFMGGDSGSAVFMKSDKGDLELIGMGIGQAYLSTSPFPVGIVTPIGSIMKALGPQYTIASFP